MLASAEYSALFTSQPEIKRPCKVRGNSIHVGSISTDGKRSPHRVPMSRHRGGTYEKGEGTRTPAAERRGCGCR